ncbi:MAG: cation:proton antiporter [Acidobacteria bacterium]|nr:cation:proton antiporter [Acidobacteriota bacterium]
MAEHILLRELVLTYVVALLFIVVLARVRIPSIVALIAAGAVAGPFALAIVSTQAEVEAMAELGIVLLLFTVGLDFSLAEIRRIWKAVVIAGPAQITATAVAVMALLLVALGGTWRSAFFIGLFVALSSTAIVLKELSERNQLDSPHGRLVVGVMLFQDVCLVVLLLVVPILSGQTPLAAAPLVLLRGLLALGVVALLSRVILPTLLRVVTRTGRREAFPLAVLVASIGTAWASSLLGVSMALGAFLAGLMLAESEFSHQAHSEIRPVRDLLASLFFISLGMLVEPTPLVRNLPLIAAVTASIIVVKAVVAAGALLMAAPLLRVAVTAALALAQVGEFSFVVGRTGLEMGLLSAARWQTLLAASILTMVVTPALVEAAPRVGSWIAGRARRPVAVPESTGIPPLANHVVILGYGVGGHLLARALRDLHVQYLIMELNGATVRQARAGGEPIFYGDATNPDTLDAAGMARAQAIVAVLSDPQATARLVTTARRLSPTVPIIARTRYRLEAEQMVRLGATLAVAEELEASLEVLAQLLARLDIPGNVIEVLLDAFRRESESVRRIGAPQRALETMASQMMQTPVGSHRLGDGDWAIGRTVAAADLRTATGALIVALKRGAQHIVSPPTDLRFEDGDVLYLVGDESDVLLARRRLTTGE